MSVELCPLSDLDATGAKGFPGRSETRGRPFFVVRQGGGVYGYINVCPHRSIPLEFEPDMFLGVEKKTIQCASHGAQFSITDGACLAGPCAGEGLEPVAVTAVGGQVILG